MFNQIFILLVTISLVCTDSGATSLKVPANTSSFLRRLFGVESITSNLFPIVASLGDVEDEGDDSVACVNRIFHLITDFYNPNVTNEAMAFVDGLGKPTSGIFSGNSVFLGSYDSCKMPVLRDKGYRSCKVFSTFKVYDQSLPVTWTSCMPAECSKPNGNYSRMAKEILKKINKNPDVLFVDGKSLDATCNRDYKYTAGSYIAFLLVVFIVCLVGIGTLWDPVSTLIASLKRTDEGRQTLINNDGSETEAIIPDDMPAKEAGTSINYAGTPPTDAKPRTSAIGEFFKCFCLFRTFGALLNVETKAGQIHCLNGIRVISINWVVLGHVYYLIVNGTGGFAYMLKLAQRNSFTFVWNGMPSVDAFFLMSGLLVSLLLSKELVKRRGKFNVLGYYIHRYIRLTAPFLVVTLVQGFLAHIYIRGPYEDILRKGHDLCVKWWWTNMLYINNLVPFKTSEICVSQSWYLSNDFQFFAVAPLFVWLLYKRPNIGVTVTSLTIAASCVCAGVISYIYKFGPSPVLDRTPGDTAPSDSGEFAMIYVKPWIRCPPYLIGVLGGWFIFRHIDSLKLWVSTKTLVTRLVFASVMWVLTGLIEYWVVFGLHYDMMKKTGQPAQHLSVPENAVYEAMARSSFAIALFVQIVLCQIGLGGVINRVLSNKVWIILSRLTFAVYLLHFVMIQSIVVQLRHVLSYQPDYEMAILYIGVLGMSYFGAVLLFVCVEQPVTFFEKLTYRR